MAQQAPLTVDEIVARKQDIINKIPATLPPNEKETMRKHIEDSLAALKNGDHAGIQSGIQGVLDVAKRNPHAGDAPGQASTGGGPHNMMSQAWMSCGDSCYHHLSDGNAAAYGVCYWGCVIFS
ncbi:MAG TPA: hypothetical protein VFW71_16335 [Actinomycetota bacterium]|nr:hypothetical protein [Actinomycetota bacterium]